VQHPGDHQVQAEHEALLRRWSTSSWPVSPPRRWARPRARSTPSSSFGSALGIAVPATISFGSLDHDRPAGRGDDHHQLLSIVSLALAFLASWRLPRRARAEAGH
jgi:hypothetical protein